MRQDILDAIEETDFKVDWGKTRIYNMIRDRGEWVISRQRVWVYHCLYFTLKMAILL